MRHRRVVAIWPGAVLALLLCLPPSLTACSSLAAPSEDAPPAELVPNYRQLVADKLRAAFRDYVAYDNFQIAEPRWVHAVRGWSWLICIRFEDHGRPRNYALYLQSDKFVDNRYAVGSDSCDTQVYAPFELMATGLSPVH